MAEAWEFGQAVLFTGHRVDAPGRAKARFPASAEAAARAAVRRLVGAVVGGRSAAAVGIAGGASGGDILFHEVCFELGVSTRLYLALPVEGYVKASVEAAGEGWARRFYAVVERVGVRVLDDSVRLESGTSMGTKSRFPSGMTNRSSGDEGESKRRFPSGMTNQVLSLNIWARTNHWMVDEAVRLAPRRTLIALWDGERGDGPGGTAHLVDAAPGLGIEVAPVISMQALVACGE